MAMNENPGSLFRCHVSQLENVTGWLQGIVARICARPSKTARRISRRFVYFFPSGFAIT
jgi:hypothetical protein